MSNLSTRDLTRTLWLSKQWQAAVLSSIDLRRILFLSHASNISYLELSDYGVESIVHQPSDRSLKIVEPHPVLWRRWKRGWVTDVAMDSVRWWELATVSPSTFLFQPPIVSIRISHRLRKVCIQRAEGVTFGAVIEALDAMCEEEEENPIKDPYNQFSAQLTIETGGTVWLDAEDEHARAKQEHATSLDELRSRIKQRDEMDESL
jgi:hypothetical protein